MTHSLEQIEQKLSLLHNGSQMDTFHLYHGIELSYLILKSDKITLPHDAMCHILEINYCKAGRMGWKMNNGNTVYLGPGNYSLHTMDVCAHSVMTLPNGYYEGLTLFINLDVLSKDPPELLADTGITGEFLVRKFCKSGILPSFAGNAQTESIFSGFYEQPESFRSPYRKLKALELLLYLGKCNFTVNEHLADYQADQVEIIRNIHEQLTRHVDQHFTIESLAKQYLINPTTLKTVFKAVYGNSIAAHTREHRMEQAAKLLLETNDSISRIAQAVGYGNQSKFTAAFKEYFQVLPTEYRKHHHQA
ncbi:helix-turn-helix transcriptional regulator [Diplocloster agilis]|uniref:Helix-turn-helix transcriptional regulator n=1 Tax=Diplocloster agilis TaxID=2850323 RepID=A0A949NFW3_9FIRM|nr:helix-turn-helix transcriptional regulator [Diplocloster agilis]MBU9738931.1 helix-turn-helix transcriptional regulator [Diplocloster agilis]MBU9746835.1 helix-turn-helix transcriptional regulator [Diplocloster agilis]